MAQNKERRCTPAKGGTRPKLSSDLDRSQRRGASYEAESLDDSALGNQDVGEVHGGTTDGTEVSWQRGVRKLQLD